MEPVLFIAALTALHVAAMALIDVLSGTKSWLVKLGWGFVIVCLPLIGAIIYYLRAGKGPKRRPAARPSRRPE